MSAPLLEVRNLSVDIGSAARRAVDGVSFTLGDGEVVGLVGESGSGKTLTAHSLLRLAASPAVITAGEVLLRGRDVLAMTETQLREIRGADVSLVFQDPLSSLNPVLRVGAQVEEAMAVHQRFTGRAVAPRAIDLMTQVRIPAAVSRARDYPHQFSGGMRQRIALAMSIANEPGLVIADEPTTALDVTVQAQVIALLRDLVARTGNALLLISHDIGVVASLCSRIMVMYAGQIVESGPADQILRDPQHPYTWSLLRSVVDLNSSVGRRMVGIPGAPPVPGRMPDGCRFHPRCLFATPACREQAPALEPAGAGGHQVRCLVTMRAVTDPVGQARAVEVSQTVLSLPRLEPGPATAVTPARRNGEDGDVVIAQLANVAKQYRLPSGFGQRARRLTAVDGVSLELRHGETLALVGESGCGKTTLGRLIVGLESVSSGTITFSDNAAHSDGRRLARRGVQMIFQDPTASLNPRMKVADLVAEPLLNARVGSKRERHERVAEALTACGLDPSAADRYPHEFSGGQRQRIGIARALVTRPRLIVADEPVASLDVSIRAQVVNLLQDLQEQFGISYLFISHDLGTVRHIADRVAVMYLGRIVELGTKEQVYGAPQHPYTRALLAAIPTLDSRPDDARVSADSEPPSPLRLPTGCRFHPRCPHAMRPQCSTEDPGLVLAPTGQFAACHLLPAAPPAGATPAGATLPTSATSTQ